ncbi:hypothetical protein GLOIN_2v1768727 [Rhizophagus clarus]|uniref:DUF3504 domain-containing protein n=1 Tax=Rhizophagus clarus TaxID=94130 RepID=A0A8H3MEN0_9GLOM|nr:hypothetical protein GLOIN_2v1768727 [Rhizophagus clarus]
MLPQKKNKKTFIYTALTSQEILTIQQAARSIKAARFAIARHINLYSKIHPQDINNKNVYPDLYNAITGKIKILTKSGFGESRGADAFTESEIQLIVNHPAMQTDSSKGLLHCIFWHNAFELALRGGEHYDLKIQHFVKRKDGGIDVIFYQSKCNQIRLPSQCDDAFYLQPCNQAEVEFTGYWYKSTHVGRNSLNKFMNEIALVTGINCDDRKFSNHSGQKTFVQYSKSRVVTNEAKNQSTSFTTALEFYKGSISENCKFKALAYLNYHIAYYIIENNISPLPLFEKPCVPFQEIKDSQNIQLDKNCIKKFLQGNTFNNCNITFNMNQ